jgi:hypothetical protein
MSGYHLATPQNAASISGGKKRRSRKTHKKHYRKRNTRKSRYSKKHTRSRYNKRNQRKHTSKKYKKHSGGSNIPAATRENEIRAIIEEFKDEIGDEEFFDGKDEQIVQEAIKRNLNDQKVKDGLYGWSKSYPPFGHI